MKNRLFTLCTVILLVWGCTSNQDTSNNKVSAFDEESIAKSDTKPDVDKEGSKIRNEVSLMSEPVLLTLKVERTEDGRAKVIGLTNLPNSANLLISMNNPSLGKDYRCNLPRNNGIRGN